MLHSIGKRSVLRLQSDERIPPEQGGADLRSMCQQTEASATQRQPPR